MTDESRHTMDRRSVLKGVGAVGASTGLSGCLGGLPDWVPWKEDKDESPAYGETPTPIRYTPEPVEERTPTPEPHDTETPTPHTSTPYETATPEPSTATAEPHTPTSTATPAPEPLQYAVNERHVYLSRGMAPEYRVFEINLDGAADVWYRFETSTPLEAYIFSREQLDEFDEADPGETVAAYDHEVVQQHVDTHHDPVKLGSGTSYFVLDFTDRGDVEKSFGAAHVRNLKVVADYLNG